MKKTLMALIAGCALVAGAAAPVLCADIVGTVHDADGNVVSGVEVSTSTQDGKSIGSAVTDSQGNYKINGVPSGLYYITLIPPSGSNLSGQSVASYVGGSGLTVNWGVAPGREPMASAMPGTHYKNAGPAGSALAYHSKPLGPVASDPVPSAQATPNCYFDFDGNCLACCQLFPNDPRCAGATSMKTPHCP